MNFHHGLGLTINKLKFHLPKFENNENFWEVPISIDINLKEKICSILNDAKVEDIKIIDLKNKTSIADFFIVATCRSSRHADSVADDVILQLKNLGIKCPNPSGRPKCDWIIVDAGDVIIHLFRPEIRDLYKLEKLWGMSFDSVKNQRA